MQHPIPLEELSGQLRKFCDPAGPAPARMMAAKGMVPLGPQDLFTVLYQLGHDPDDKVRDAAMDKFGNLPEAIINGALQAPLDPRVLDFSLDRFAKRDEALQLIMTNQGVADETVARCATWAGENLSELIATNEQRMLRHPRIIENLYQNKKARMSTVNRAVELAVRHEIVLENIATYKEVAAAIKGELITEETGPSPADHMFNDALVLGEELEEEAGPEAVEQELTEEVAASEKRMSIQAQLGAMTTSEKVRMALLGNSSHRAILIRDTNKLVAMAAIKSPSIRDTEAMAYSRNRSLNEDVVRYICAQKDWTKHYSVKLNLVQNPKTPLPKAMSFLMYLRQNDLRTIARNKNVPAAVAKAAKHQLRKRM
jgi:hypothetical protein